MDKNHPQCIQGPIDGLATDEGGSEPEGVTYKWIGDKRRVFSVCAKDIVFKMAATAFLIAAALLGHARADVIDLKCSDNATCIEDMAKDFVRSIRQQKTMRIFDVLTIEPIGTRQARSNEGLLSRLLSNNAFSLDWNDYTFRIWKAQDRQDALDLEVFEGRTAKDVSEDIPKKSKSKVGKEEEEPEEEDKIKKSPKGIRRRRTKKRLLQAVIPMVFGMKSSAALIFAMFLVTAITLKAFVLSKLALIVTVAMALKRLYESYSMGIPEALWNLARYFRILFGLPAISPLSESSMTMPMYVMPQMYQQAMAQQLGQLNHQLPQ
ncbi:uncharacterized protein LOC113232360 isoform X2 [Hyposmocoma kahamanoa]|uniref:uncharacterized protein LOC113232360 isoform X2 n=1 Tax=Hyposmocoma kahamanoa TaxID=1477025 RepID=UPI000E6DA4E0|nr:uncharacterized protein LOC113232360 isoform X2 [Hyposmocoma kahamanoa]